MNFWKRYPADYQRKTARLTLAQHGAYTLLLDELYTTETGLPADVAELFRICRAMSKPEQDAVRVVAGRFFPINGDGLRHNSRAAEELEEAAPAVQAARTNGKKGGRPKKPKPEPTNNPAGSESQTQKEPSSKAPHSSELREEKEKPPSGVQGAKRGLRNCPSEFLVTAELQAWARQSAPLVDIRAETAIFRSTERKVAITDWPKAWQKWMLVEQKRLAEKRPVNGAITDVGYGLETLAERAKRERIAELTGGLASRQPTQPPGPPLPAFAPPETFHALEHDER